jgi:hypothetical protein
MCTTMTNDRPRRELAHRAADGIEVALFWSEPDNSIALEILDSGTDTVLEFAVAPERALDAFYHPFAYAARQGIHYELARPEHGTPGSVAVTR